MTNPLENIINEFDRLRKPPLFVWWDQWIADEAWVDYILQYGNLSHCTNRDFNRAFRNSEVYKIILSSDAKNDVGIYFHKKYVNNRKVSFYYVAKDVNSVPDRPSDKDEWKAFLQGNHIGCNTWKWAHETSL